MDYSGLYILLLAALSVILGWLLADLYWNRKINSPKKRDYSMMVLGGTETVVFPELDDLEVEAKIDTGARHGAVHAENIREDKEEGLLHFSIGDAEYATDDYYVQDVRFASGEAIERYNIRTKVEILSCDGSSRGEYPIEIGLFDRSKMKYPCLIGKNFLVRNNFLVDPRANQWD